MLRSMLGWLLCVLVVVLANAAAVPAAPGLMDLRALAGGQGRLHPAVDVGALDLGPDAMANAGAAIDAAIKARQSEDDLLKPWLTPCPKLKRSWVRWLNPSACVTSVLYTSKRLRWSEEQTAQALDSAKLERLTTLGLKVQLVAAGKGTWILPINVKPGDRELLESVKFVLSVDDKVNLQPAAAPTVEIKEAKRGQLTDLIGITKPRTDYIGTFSVGFALRDDKGQPTITAEAKKLTLVLVGPKEDLDEVPLELAKLPAELPKPVPAKAR